MLGFVLRNRAVRKVNCSMERLDLKKIKQLILIVRLYQISFNVPSGHIMGRKKIC
jgi:hypothetical protein